MTVVYLHGDLRQFGGPFEFDIGSVAEAVRALCSQVKGFRRRLSDGSFRVVRLSDKGRKDIPLKAVTASYRNLDRLHIVPVTAGSGSGTGKAILGVALVAAAFAFAPALPGFFGGGLQLGETAFSVMGVGVSYGQIAGLGAMMVLGGAAQMLSPSKSSSSSQNTDSSYYFSNPVNVTSQGGIRPLCFGEFVCGTTVASSSIVAEQI